MTNLDSISPAKYWRQAQKWPKLINKTGVVIASTKVEHGLPELSASAPYWIVLIKFNEEIEGRKIHLFLGADGHSYKINDKVKCVLKRMSSAGNGLIHYGIKVAPIMRM